jgi:hypothetical protein
MVPCHAIAGSLDTTRSHLIFNWVIPVALAMSGIKRSTLPSDSPTPTMRAEQVRRRFTWTSSALLTTGGGGAPKLEPC